MMTGETNKIKCVKELSSGGAGQWIMIVLDAATYFHFLQANQS